VRAAQWRIDDHPAAMPTTDIWRGRQLGVDATFQRHQPSMSTLDAAVRIACD
jgi:hypothetical protein